MTICFSKRMRRSIADASRELSFTGFIPPYVFGNGLACVPAIARRVYDKACTQCQRPCVRIFRVNVRRTMRPNGTKGTNEKALCAGDFTNCVGRHQCGCRHGMDLFRVIAAEQFSGDLSAGYVAWTGEHATTASWALRSRRYSVSSAARRKPGARRR